MLDDLKRRLPLPVRNALVEARAGLGAFLLDAGTWVLGQRDDRTPPARLHFVGNGNFGAVGYEFLRYFVELGELKPTDSVLDVGCGVGRMALPLTNYLKQGRYVGFDIVPKGIDWCKKHITPRHPNFEFVLADIHNGRYNPRGTVKGSEYRFPVQDASVDFVFLTSVFTHLLLPEATHYLAEIGRVLRPGGRVLSTWFLLNEDARARIAESDRSPRLVHPGPTSGTNDEDVRIHDPKVPEAAVGFSETLVRALHERAGLTVREPIAYGSWCGRPDFLSYQDIVVARRV